MPIKERQRWRDLCEQAAVETDLSKFMDMVDKINAILQEREERLRTKAKGKGAGQA